MPTMAEKGQSCRVIETIELPDLLANSARDHIFNLSAFARASNIAPNFKFYRAAKVIYTYDPLFNTFQDGNGTANASKPYMYSVMNRTQVTQTSPVQQMGSLVQFQCTGARPVPLVSQRKISYKPNWCSPGLLQLRTTVSPGQPNIQDYSTNGLQAQYGWLATPSDLSFIINADQTGGNAGAYPLSISHETPPAAAVANSFVYLNMVVYNGHQVYIDQKYTGGDPSDQPVARVTCTVLWEFKEAQNPLRVTPGDGLPTVAPKTT